MVETLSKCEIIKPMQTKQNKQHKNRNQPTSAMVNIATRLNIF